MMRLIGLVWMLLLLVAPAFAQEENGESARSEDPVAEAAGETPAGDTDAPDGTPDDTPEAPVEAIATTGERPEGAGEGPFVVVCPIDDEIDEGLAVVVKRAVESARYAEALLFVINTPGGRVDSAIEITTAIMGVECPTIAFIEGMGAISAGALISYSCDYIYMAEGTSIGASTPVMPGAQTSEAMDEKSSSFIRSKYQALGEANGHEPLLGLAMVDRNIEVRAYRGPDGTYHFQRTDRAGGSGGDAEEELLEKIRELLSEDPDQDEGLGDVLREVLDPEGSGPANPGEARIQVSGAEARDLIEAHTEIVSRRGELLTLSSREAEKYGLAAAITTDVEDTLRQHELETANRVTITPTWEEALFAFLTSPTIAGLLLMGGLGGLYVEARTPGFGAPGIIGATCLALFFGAHMVLGMASWIDLALILAGFLLIMAEVFLLPGFGVAGVVGIGCLIAGSYMALLNAPIPEFTWEFQRMNDALYTLTIAMVSLIVFIATSGLIIPYSPLANVLVLHETQDTAAGYTVQRADEAESSIGLTGVATSPLRPAGRGRFGSKTYDVVTRGEFIDRDSPIRIIESSGNRYVVTEAKPEESA